MNFKKVMEHYSEEMNFEVLWDIMLINNADSSKRTVVKETSKRYWGADPFLFEHDGKTYLFYERYDRKKKKGLIAYRTVEEDLTYSDPQIAIEENFHMSFPHIFTYNEEIYIIPETSAVGQIRLYRALDFPSKWELVKTVLADFPAVDTIVFNSNEQGIVLHTSLGDSCKVENYIIECDNTFNFIKKYKVKDFSERGNRNAGKIKHRNGKMIRVGQDCSGKVYGKGLVMYECVHGNNEVETATISYRDFTMPDDGYCGIHTYNELDDIRVIDLKYMFKKPWYKKITFLIKKCCNAVKRRLQRRK